MSLLKNLTVLVPYFNEEKNIFNTLSCLKYLSENGASIMFIDKGTDDLVIDIIKSRHINNYKIINYGESVSLYGAIKNLVLNIETDFFSIMRPGDWCSKDYYVNQINLLINNNLDIVRTEEIEVDLKKRTKSIYPCLYYNKQVKTNDYIGLPDKTSLIDFNNIWTFVYSTSFIVNSKIYDGLPNVCDSMIIHWKCVLSRARIAIGSEYGYFYNQNIIEENNSSIATKVIAYRNLADVNENDYVKKKMLMQVFAKIYKLYQITPRRENFDKEVASFFEGLSSEEFNYLLSNSNKERVTFMRHFGGNHA